MMSNSNNRSPIMMNIKDKSPIKKISKVARRGTKLAASAAHKGSQFYEQVHSRMAEVDSSNSRDNNKQSSPSRHRAAASVSDMANRSRVRDQINRFNSAAVPSQRGSNDGGNHSTSKESRHHENEVTTSTRRKHRQQQHNENKSLVEHTDGNEMASYNPSYYEKENESNLPASIDATVAPYSFTSKDGVRVLSPAMHRQRRKSPKKGSSSTSSPQKATLSPKNASSSSRSNPSPPAIEGNNNNSETTYDETEMLKRQLRALEKDNEKLMKRNSRLERKCDKLTRDNSQLMEEVEVHAAGNNSSSSTADAAHRRQDNSNSQGNAASYGAQQEEQLNKRDPEEHPLIGSPLRKHMKFVHESAESNCTVTMRKAPFPLLPPEQTRVIMEARRKIMEEEQQDDEKHLGMLGNVTGTPSLDVDANFALSYKKRRGKRVKDGEEDGSAEEEAVDLLTSAAFMFKTSRRKLG